MKRFDGKSMDIVSDNIARLKEIFPDVFSEGKIDFEALEATLGEYVDTKEERYSFNWNGKAKARRIAQTPSTGTLRPVKEESKNWDTTENLYIEGDNLEVLKLLQKSYHKQVKMIYIDPPYNTGKDFVYKDNFKDNIKNYLEITGQVDSEGNKLSTNSDTSGRYHSDWLNMMYPRLKLARNLLRDDGVIFISIDDNEVANLRKICDEIFGEDNFIGEFVINSSPSAIDYGHMGKTHDYALFYVKNNTYATTNQLEEKDKKFKYEDSISPYNLYPLYNGNVAFNPITRPNLYYPFYLNPHNIIDKNFYEIGLEEKDGWVEVYPVISRKDGIQRVWRWGKEKASRDLNKEIIGYKSVEGEFRIVQKTRHTSKLIRSLLIDNNLSSRRGTSEVEVLFSKKIFSFPKTEGLLKKFISVGTNKNDIILDLFSGSATTAHAVMHLNSEDDGNRKYICVQLPENTDEKSEAYKAGYKNICEIGKERIRRAGEKIVGDETLVSQKDGTKVPTPLDIGFKVFKLDSSNIKAWNPESENLEESLFEAVNNIKSDRTKEDILYEILLKYGLDLTLPIEELDLAGKKVYVVGLGALVVCLDEQITLDTVEEIAKLKEQYESDDLMRVVFRDNGFKDAEVKTNAIQILKQSGIDDVKSL